MFTLKASKSEKSENFLFLFIRKKRKNSRTERTDVYSLVCVCRLLWFLARVGKTEFTRRSLAFVRGDEQKRQTGSRMVNALCVQLPYPGRARTHKTVVVVKGH